MDPYENLVEMWIGGLDFNVEFGSRSAKMTLKSDEEAELVRMLLEDPNLWSTFLGSLSAAINKDFDANN